MTNAASSEAVLKMATDIVLGCLAQGSVNPSDVPKLIQDVRAALEMQIIPSPPSGPTSVTAPEVLELDSAGDNPNGPATVSAPVRDERAPAVPVDESVTDDYIISLEDGQRFRSLRRHLMAKYGMTPTDYRRRWGLPPDYPMVAASYARERSQVAKRIGLGKGHAFPMQKVRRASANKVGQGK